MNKRWLIVLCLCLCGCQMIGEQTEIAEDAPVEKHERIAEQWRFHYEQLDDSLKVMYETMYAGMCAYEEEIVLEGIEEAQLEALFRSVIEDHPQLFYVGASYRYTIYADGTLCFFPQYVYDEKQREEIQSRIDASCDTILRDAPKEEEALAAYLYEYVITHAEYEPNDHDQQMDSFFLQGKSVCAGYARAYQYLMQYAGLRCTTVSGELNAASMTTGSADRSHAWNLVWLDDDWFYVDATSGDIVQYGPHTCYQFFKLSSQEAQLLYTASIELPSTRDPSQSYFHSHHYYLEGYEEAVLQEAIAAMKERGDQVLELRTSPDQTQALQDALLWENRIFYLLAQNGIWVESLGCARIDELGSIEFYYE